jgi:hypothetical protein
MRLLLLAGLIALSGCATKQGSPTYWTQKSGVVAVHHVAGKTDSVEKLTHMQLSADELKAAGLPNGTYFKVVQAQGQPSRAPTPSAPTDKGSVATEDGLATLSNQLRTLKNQVKTVEAENQRLQNEMNAPERQKTAEEQPVERQADAQLDVRLSQ